MSSDLRVVRTDRVDVDALADVYRKVHAAELHLVDHTDPSPEQRLQWTVEAPGFAAAVALDGDRPIGTVMGCPLPAETLWWRDLTSVSDPALVREWDGRTFAVCEAFVLPEYRRQQVGVRMFSDLLASRPEERVTLAVADTNTAVWRALRMLKWEHVGDLIPFPGWRPHQMLVRPLPWRPAS
ncbi:hypothetical protein Val02_36350 [Virgisporangium aliadipatigenens]|uniref:N-acetyltransferase domain-containing protein n=1 Tax=Virgisporangium aliadipatigenens TaxID=741659 RepID=A0A8J4DQM0_9ACTN|nr:GNAT family N-acetyltransferase [Virgisporangium aliadipatigenens]GIJ46749.1 hypothetical protein Val02_36350 [Virgisporangium aliadipatigenens]